MRDVTRQLERVRSLGRWMLIAQRLSEWVGVVVAGALLAGLLDFALRLPAWLRLALGLAAVAGALFWIITRLARALALRPDLGAIALHAERLYPELSGQLASGVEFALRPELFADGPRSAAMAQASVRALEERLEGRTLQLINPRPTLGRFALCALAVIVAAVVVAAAPDAASTALRRWLNPLGAAEWPRRTAVVSLVSDRVWPSDTPLRVRARVEKGYRRAMRTWVAYRLVSPAGAGPWQSVLLNEQASSAAVPSGRAAAGDAPLPADASPRGIFERLIDLPMPGAPAPTTASASDAGAKAQSVELFFEAGDDRTRTQSIALVDRPALVGARLDLQPPDYAQGLVSPQQIDLDQQAGQIASASALAGSRVRWALTFNKPMPAPWLRSERFLPGMHKALLDPALRAQVTPTAGGTASAPASAAAGAAPAAPASPRGIDVSFRLMQSVQSPVHLQDEFGLTNQSDRLYRVEATIDQPPAASMTLPLGDEAVLPGATVPLQGLAQDDVGAESVELQIETRRAAPDTASAAPAAPGAASAPAPAPLARVDGRSPRLQVDRTLDLAPLRLIVGDEVLATAVARDLFELDGRRHEPVRSTPRRLRVIDAATFVGQIQADLAGVRQQAINLANRQRELLDAPADKAQPAQQDLTARVEAQAGLLRSLRDRVARNKLNDPSLAGLLGRAKDLLDKAREESQQADTKLDQARKASKAQAPKDRAQAKANQQNVAEGLSSLAAMLDQGRDTAAMQLQLRQLLAQQEELQKDTRQALPRTLGKSPEQLSPEDRKRLAELAERQAGLTSKADATTRQMQAAADGLAQQPDPQSQAAAQALSDAAAVAQRQGLTQSMQQAGESAKQNKLSESAAAQESSAQTMKQMLAQMDNQEQRQAEVLRRRLEALAEAVQKLVQQQTVQIERLAAARELAGLDEPQAALRRNTISVEEQARGGAAEAARHLGQAAQQQAAAVAALRDARRDPAAAGQKLALASLDAALAELRKARDQSKKDDADENRRKLQAQYEKLAKEQEDLGKQTRPLATKPGLSRRERVDLIDLGHRQADVQSAAGELGRQVAQTLLFKHLHDQIERLAGRTVSRLRAGQADPLIPRDQQQMAGHLRTMAAALAEAQKKKEEFDSGPSQGGGEGGGGSGSQPLIPPLAELRLLQGLQQDMLARTRFLDEVPAQAAPAGDEADPAQPTPAQTRDKDVVELSAQQRELASLGERLINQMMAQQGAMTPEAHDNADAPRPRPQPPTLRPGPNPPVRPETQTR